MKWLNKTSNLLDLCTISNLFKQFRIEYMDEVIFVFQKTGIITKPKQTECNVNSYNKDTVAFCKCECPDLIKQTGDEELHYSS